jgi:hypothetical protein
LAVSQGLAGGARRECTLEFGVKTSRDQLIFELWRRGGRPRVTLVDHEDNPCTEEADAADDLSGDPGWIDDDSTRREHVAEAILADQHE